MTLKEKVAAEEPEKVDPKYMGGVFNCPGTYTYLRNTSGVTEGCPYGGASSDTNCSRCWSRLFVEKEEPEETPENTILDSGARREFETGAVRDIQEGKGRCDLMPLDVVSEIINYQIEDNYPYYVLQHIYEYQSTGASKHLIYALNTAQVKMFKNYTTMLLEAAKQFEDGAKKYGEYNWQKGMPTHCYIDSAVRHYLKWLRGDKDEPHDRAFVWNILCCIWTCIHKPELNDYTKNGGTEDGQNKPD